MIRFISPTLFQLVEKYSSGDAEVTALVQKYDWVILPVFNVDGYEYTHTGYRLWRKTRSDRGSYCKGADPNRNWNYKWGGEMFSVLQSYLFSSASNKTFKTTQKQAIAFQIQIQI